MSSIFQQALTDISGLEAKVLGPRYDYWKQINSPEEMHMSSEGNLPTLGRNINGLVNYVELLVTGDSDASRTGGPLGNRFFLQTSGKCSTPDKDADGKHILASRYIYVDHVPDGNIPFISAGMGQNFSDFRGLIPGTISNLNTLNPAGLFGAFMNGTNPPCQQITLETIDNNNNHGRDTQFVTVADIQGQKLRDLGSHKQYTEGFTNNNQLPEDPIAQAYFVSLCILGLYILYLLYIKRK